MRVRDMTGEAASRLALAVGLTFGLAACADTSALKPMAARGPACNDVVFPIYFGEKSDVLTPVAQQVITASVAEVQGCRIGYVNVLGLTDADGSKAQNLDLSKRRADAVAKALSGAGLQTPKFEVEGAGETGAISDSGKAVPLRRKTEVIIHPLPGVSQRTPEVLVN